MRIDYRKDSMTTFFITVFCLTGLFCNITYGLGQYSNLLYKSVSPENGWLFLIVSTDDNGNYAIDLIPKDYSIAPYRYHWTTASWTVGTPNIEVAALFEKTNIFQVKDICFYGQDITSDRKQPGRWHYFEKKNKASSWTSIIVSQLLTVAIKEPFSMAFSIAGFVEKVGNQEKQQKIIEKYSEDNYECVTFQLPKPSINFCSARVEFTVEQEDSEDPKFGILLKVEKRTVFGQYESQYFLVDLDSLPIINNSKPVEKSSSFQWHQLPRLTFEQPGACAVVIGQKLYLMGGHVSPDKDPWSHKRTQIFNLQSHTWGKGSDMHKRRRGAGCGVIQGPDGKAEIYVVGGYSGYSGLSSVERYIPSQNIWQMVASRGFAGENPMVAVVNNKLYAMGGHQNNGVCSSLNEVYDRDNNKWIIKSSIKKQGQPITLVGALTVAVNNKIYLFGGRTYKSGWKEVTSALIYNTQNDSWSSGQDMPQHRASGHAVAFGSQIYLFGGNSSSTNHTIDVYDTTNNTWTTVADFPGSNCLNPNIAQSKTAVFVIGDYWHGKGVGEFWHGNHMNVNGITK